MQCYCENNSLTKISWYRLLYVQVVVECHFRGSFHHSEQNQSPLQMKVVRTFSLRFVSYIYFINSFWILVFFSSPLEEPFCVFKIFKMSAIFKMATKTRHKKWAVKIQHCPISTTFHIWVDYDVPNWFLTSTNFYRSPFSKWPPQYRKNSTLFDFKGSFWFIF